MSCHKGFCIYSLPAPVRPLAYGGQYQQALGIYCSFNVIHESVAFLVTLLSFGTPKLYFSIHHCLIIVTYG